MVPIEVAQYDDFRGGVARPCVLVHVPFVCECVDALVVVVVVIDIKEDESTGVCCNFYGHYVARLYFDLLDL